ncbi:MAG: AraC family transcriptional regulator [Algoriphagus sp.]|uniref:helix-turn-helix domain-containing protein n=1 Tax=Algoriphagus sp. TaxID=1872435 RepID=UPI0026274BEF|nr:AraC family transcriptional regulator [Algoriphagus sp.]MDG1276552.1 AraC family transcriptional regulator [Algoriphagus sp.]
MSRVISFQIPKSQREFIRFQEDRGAHFYDKLHQHPQLQLTLILEGKGQFLSGDYVGRFQPGDIFFLGENVPHVFRSDPEYFEAGSEFIVAGNTVFFDFQALGKAIQEVEELNSLEKFREMAGSCFQVTGEVLDELREIIGGFSVFRELERFLFGIKLLTLLESECCELIPLNQSKPNFNERDGTRMNHVMQFLLENRFQAISLDQVAEKANLSKEAFCRFFKLRTQRTFTQYLQQLRISEAQKLLSETELSISEIAFRVGYENLSYFNRSFKKLANSSPREWRKEKNPTSA